MTGPRNRKIVSATVVAGLYGSIRLHPRVPPGDGGQDAYSVFASRAVSLGWARTGMDGLTESTIWGINDAGQDWSSHDDLTRLAWFQVGLSDETGGGNPLPIQPILACAEDTVNWFGELILTGVQVLLPVQVTGDARGHLASGLSLFADSIPGSTVPIRISLDAGYEDIRPAAEAIFANLRIYKAAPFTFESYSVDARDAVALRPDVVGENWMGSVRHPVTFSGTAPEPGITMLGWVLELCADACRLAGIRTTVLASVIQGG